MTLNSLSGAVGGAQKCSEHKLRREGSAVFSAVGGSKTTPFWCSGRGGLKQHLMQWEGQQLGQWEGLIQPLVQKEGLSSLFSAVGVQKEGSAAYLVQWEWHKQPLVQWEGLSSLFSAGEGLSSLFSAVRGAGAQQPI